MISSWAKVANQLKFTGRSYSKLIKPILVNHVSNLKHTVVLFVQSKVFISGGKIQFVDGTIYYYTTCNNINNINK